MSLPANYGIAREKGGVVEYQQRTISVLAELNEISPVWENELVAFCLSGKDNRL